MTTLVAFHQATIVHPSQEVALRQFTWQVQDGETWAMVGPVGAGKSTLAETILGRHRLMAGTVQWPLIETLKQQGHTIESPSDVIRLVSFKEESAQFSYHRHYYQQRFNFIEPEDDLTLDQFLRANGSPREDELQVVSKRLGIAHLRSLSLIKLSNGQIRRARIARALLSHPEWLILDEPFLGLDQSGRAELIRYLDDIRQHGTRLLFISRPEFIPPWVTNIIELGRPDGVWTGPRSDWKAVTPPLEADRELPSVIAEREPIIELTDIHVQYGGKKILNGLNWTVRAGERWALVGPNGSGKSTVLSLICGDHPQAYSNDVKLFGKARGTGESIWDLKRRMGLVSPEFHLYFSEPLTAAATAATGFFDALIARTTTPEQEIIVRNFFEDFGITHLADRPFARLSTGQQRLVLLIRALVKRPEVLLLDEPFQGLDSPSITKARSWLDHHLTPQQTLLFVSHDPLEIPRCVTKWFTLEVGSATAE
jgi:molybdate transport system ATP-binding protein